MVVTRNWKAVAAGLACSTTNWATTYRKLFSGVSIISTQTSAGVSRSHR